MRTQAMGNAVRLALVFCLIGSGPVAGDTRSVPLRLRLTAEERGSLLEQVAELSQDIVIATVKDTTSFRSRSLDYTRFSGTVIESIKGESRPRDEMVFSMPAGSSGQHVGIGSDEDPVRIGRSYLLFLSTCRDDLGKVPFDEMMGKVVGDTIRLDNPVATFPAAALVDSIRSLCKGPDIGTMSRSSALVVLGMVIDRDPVGTDEQTSRTVRVVSPLKQVGGPAVQADSVFQFILPVVRGRYARTPGTRPALHEGRPYMLFLGWTGSGWTLLPSAYAAWEREDSLGSVHARSLQCPDSTEVLVAKAAWDSLLSKVRE